MGMSKPPKVASRPAAGLRGAVSAPAGYGAAPRARNFFLHFDSVITINRHNLAPPTLPDVLVTGR